MIDTQSLLYFLLSFIVGSAWVSIITFIAEKKGTLIGGILGGLPSTSAFSFLFIGINQSPIVAVQATTIFPLAFSITIVYLFFYAFFAQKSFVRGIIISLVIWLLISGLIIVLDIENFVFCLIGGVVISMVTYYGFVRKLKLASVKIEGQLYKSREIVFRGVGAGLLVAFAVFLSQVGGSILGGIASAFPAVFTSTLIILNSSRGTQFSRSITKPLVLSGILTIIPFSVAVRFLFPSVGVFWGTLYSYILVIPLAVFSYILARN